jgi:hypothetical protein
LEAGLREPLENRRSRHLFHPPEAPPNTPKRLGTRRLPDLREPPFWPLTDNHPTF